MSFSKAKIHRYYDQQTCAPPPGTYDPKLEPKVKGTVIVQSKRFSDPRLSSASSLDSLDSSTSVSSQIFRTPSMRKKISFSNRTPSKAMQKLLKGDDSLMEQLADKNEQIKSLLSQINMLNEKMDLLSASHKVELKNVSSDQEEEVAKLRKSLNELRGRLENEKVHYNEKLGEMKNQILRMGENMSNYMTANKKLEESLHIKESMCEELGKVLSDMTSNYSNELEKFKKTCSNLDEVNRKIMQEYQSLIEDFDREKMSSIEDKICIGKLQDRLDAIQDDVNQAVKRCRLYEVIQKETSKTVNVLTKRLIESEDEIEHLSKVEKDLLSSKEKLEKETISLSEENRRIKESIDFLQQAVVQEVQNIQSHLMAKLEMYKKVAQEENLKLLGCLQEKQSVIDHMLSEIDLYKNQKQDLEIELSHCHSIIKDYKSQVNMLEENATELEHDFEDKIAAQRALFTQLSKEYDNLKKTFCEEKASLENRISQLRSESMKKEDDNAQLTQKIDSLQREVDSAISTFRCILEKIGEPHLEGVSTLKDHLDKFSEINYKNNEELKKYTEENEVMFRQIKILEDISGDKDNKIDILKSQLEEYKVYSQCVTDSVVSLKNEIAEKEKKLSMYQTDIEIIHATLIQVSEKYEEMKKLHEAEVRHVEEIERETIEMQNSHQGYMDEVISELVLEKERVSELSVTIDLLKNDKSALEEKLSSALPIEGNKYESSLLKDKVKHLEKTLAELAESVQIFEYERIAQEFLIEELMAHGDDLLGVIARQNNEIDALSETADNHFAQVHQLTTREKNFLSEIDSLKTQSEAIQSQKEFYKNELSTKSQEMSELEEKLNLISIDVAEKNETIQLINKNLEDTKQLLSGDINLYKHECEIKTKELSELKEKNESIELINKNLKDTQELLTNDIHLYKHECEIKAQELSELKEKYDMLITAVSEKDEVIELVTKELEDTKELLTFEIDELKKINDAISSNLSEKDIALEFANKQMEKMTEELCEEVNQAKVKYDAIMKRKEEYKRHSFKLDEELRKTKILLEEKELLLMNTNEQSMRVTSLEAENADLHSRIKELTDMIGPFRDQLMNFEMERKLLLSKNENTKKELEALIMEKAKALGHQNNKQKIKHVVNLYETISNLRKENDKFRTENNKLRKELLSKSQTKKKLDSVKTGKKSNNENVALNSEIVPPKSKVENTSSPGKALKDKN